MARNRRKHPRVRPNGGLSAELWTGGGQHTCVVENLSAGGAFLQTTTVHEPGESVFVEFIKPGWKKTIALTAKVTNVVATAGDRLGGIGLQFEALANDARNRVDELLVQYGAPVSYAPPSEVTDGRPKSIDLPPAEDAARIEYGPVAMASAMNDLDPYMLDLGKHKSVALGSELPPPPSTPPPRKPISVPPPASHEPMPGLESAHLMAQSQQKPVVAPWGPPDKPAPPPLRPVSSPNLPRVSTPQGIPLFNTPAHGTPAMGVAPVPHPSSPPAAPPSAPPSTPPVVEARLLLQIRGLLLELDDAKQKLSQRDAELEKLRAELAGLKAQ
ncbi:MAG: PilZ domain-containing protein [Deltaproteobacteria bacterium]|nr:PilZ domain-containing protein [Deltaproteobacteria bacterium]